jgi:DNA-binding response OmpR family regulator
MAHILVVDDEPEIVQLVSRVLEARGHRVTIARDGQECLDKIAGERPDVLVIDLNLPKVDGFEVCRRLKSAEDTRTLPIVMMTAAFPSLEDADRGLSTGADEYVVKPFLREVLVHNVERLLPKPAAQEQG